MIYYKELSLIIRYFNELTLYTSVKINSYAYLVNR
jgi:hypothetical protein